MAGVRIAVRVTPRASREEIAGWRGSELVARVTSSPTDGKANAAVERLIASALGVPPSSVTVVRGHTSRHKQLEVEGVDEGDVQMAFGQPAD